MEFDTFLFHFEKNVRSEEWKHGEEKIEETRFLTLRLDFEWPTAAAADNFDSNFTTVTLLGESPAADAQTQA